MLVQTELTLRLERHGEEFEKRVEDWIASAEIRMAEFQSGLHGGAGTYRQVHRRTRG